MSGGWSVWGTSHRVRGRTSRMQDEYYLLKPLDNRFSIKVLKYS